MKKLILSLVVMFVFAMVSSASFAQNVDLKAKDLKAIKEARKEAKKLEKEGWSVPAGSLPLEKLLEKAWEKQIHTDEDGYPLWYYSDGNAVAGTISAADLQALELAKLNLAGQIETNIRGLVEASIANQQLTREEAASLTKVVGASKNIIATKLSRVNPDFKIYRNVGKENVEVQLRLFYSRKMALQAAKEAIQLELEKETIDLHEKLDDILGL